MKIINLLILFLVVNSTIICQKRLIGAQAPKIEVDKWIYPTVLKKKEIPVFDSNYVVIDFWFIDCAPCVASIPHLNKLVKKYPDINFLSVTFDNKEKILKFLTYNDIYYPIGIDKNSTLIEKFGVEYYPTSFIIDNKNKVIWKGSPFEITEAKLNELIGNKTISSESDNNEFFYEDKSYTINLEENLHSDVKSTYSHRRKNNIIIYNENLVKILGTIFNLNNQRIITHDTSFLAKRYNLYFLNNSNNDTSLAQTNFALENLFPKSLNIELKRILKDTSGLEIKIANIKLLNSFIVNGSFKSVSVKNGTWNAKGVSMYDLGRFIEDYYAVFTNVLSQEGKEYEFSLPVNDFDKLTYLLLEKYGILIQKKKINTNFLLINK